jgi:hypothetical protein
MAFDVKMPDGTLIRNVPDGTTQEDILERYQLSKQPQEVGTSETTQPTATPPEPQKRSMLEEAGRQVGLTGRAAYEAFTSPATAVLEGVRGAYNLGAQALGSESRMASPAAAQSRMLTNVGLPTPENTTERAVQAGTQAMASTAGIAKLAPQIPAFAADLARQIPSSGFAGLISQPIAEKVKDITGSDLAALVAGVGFGAAGAAGAGKVISAGKEMVNPTLFTMEQVKKRASDSYASMDQQGVTIKPDSTRQLITDIRTSLEDARMIPGTDQANAVNATLAQVSKIINDKGVSFTALDKIRATLNDLKGSTDKDIKRLGGVAVSKVDDYISNLNGNDIIAGKEGLDKAVKNVMSARKDWRNASRASVLDDALNVAEAKALDPKASESELIRRGFINIAANKDKMKLFNTTEQNIIKSVAQGGTLDPVLTFASQFSPLRSKLAAAGSAYGITQFPMTTAAIAGGGLAAETAQGVLRSRAARQAVKQIASGAKAPPPNLAYQGLLTGALNPQKGQVSVQGISDEELKALLAQ